MRESIISNSISVYVSDDSPDDDTEDMLRGLANRVPHVQYRRNQPALRHDRNVIRTLLWPTEDYVWILGDAGWVVPGAFEKVLGLLNEQDFLFVNSHSSETPNIPQLDGDAARRLVRDLFWHQTLTGATIYSRHVLEWLRFAAPDAEGLVSNFPHLCVLVDFMAAHRTTVGWVGARSSRFAPKESYWRNSALKVWAEDWSAAVCRQPSVIFPRERPAVLRSHSAHMNLFNADLLILLRQRGDLNKTYLRDHPEVWHAAHLPGWQLWAIGYCPLLFLAIIQKSRQLLRWLRRGTRTRKGT